MRVKKTETLAVPMSSMIDIVFLLLIYFIVTMEDEIPEAHLSINLPSPGSKRRTTRSRNSLSFKSIRTNSACAAS